MRETQFIAQNQEKWRQFEEILNDNSDKDPDQLNDMFIQVTDDLSYSRTFYPNRSVRVYLNDLAQRVFHYVHKSHKSPWKAFGLFWTEELPQLYFEARRDMLISLFVFLLAMGIGVLSSYMDPEFPAQILGQTYIDMTEENIRTGDPMAVYKEKGMFDMSLAITLNNLQVALLTFVSGIFYALGSILVLLFNGVMVGAFQYFFVEKGLFLESFLTIWVHGSIEIPCIVVAGAAGITMGRGLAFPGTYSRTRAFQISSRRGMKMMVGLAPLVILAGFIEGYLTRHTEAPDAVRATFITLCFLMVGFYFVFYPFRKARMGFKQPIQDPEPAPELSQPFKYNVIMENGEIFTETFRFFRRYFRPILAYVVLTTAIYTFTVFFFTPVKPDQLFYFSSDPFSILGDVEQFFFNPQVKSLWFICLFCLSLLCTQVNRLMLRDEDPEQLRAWAMHWGQCIFGAGMLLCWILLPVGLTILAAPIAFAFALSWNYIQQVENTNPLNAFARVFNLLMPRFGKVMALGVILILLNGFFLMLLSTGILQFMLGVVQWLVNLNEEQAVQVSIWVNTGLTFFLMQIIVALYAIAMGFLYYTLAEMEGAGGLWQKAHSIGLQERIRGLDRE
jgi:uncharacterized membrane protein SpoIIM required for sporulation